MQQLLADLLIAGGAVAVIVAVGALAGGWWALLLAGVLLAFVGFVIHTWEQPLKRPTPKDEQ